MNIPDELIKKIIDNLSSADSHMLFAIGPGGTVAEQIIRKTLEEDEIQDAAYKAGYIRGQMDAFKEVDDRVKEDTSQDPEEKRALGHEEL